MLIKRGWTRAMKAYRATPAGEKVYTDADAFVPERWYSRADMIKEKSAFAPFSVGTYDDD